MNYYAARQNSETGKWKYVMINRREGTFSVGYCAGDKCAGHNTKEGAEYHYKQYLLDNRLRFWNQTSQDKCKICGEWTTGIAEVDTEIFKLCPEHQTKQIVSDLYGEVGEIWSSY